MPFCFLEKMKEYKMYDDDQTEVRAKAMILISEVRRALANGIKHYRIRDDKLLETEEEILQTLCDDGEIYIVPMRLQ
ncbi:MAG: hypothetical protein DRH50_10980 [Deltaproteobacteria bacterium]|nr:MAG: hypothetical protein DRH50_10980 [Deltaproteobacteria bacterium]